ncbi:L-aspartate oxidase [Tumebacillus sp. ITR2]|uniref:L-aspartate oxidase n=1 Tax=Tumebacillus amylolyticus TaxID=2801339 RepID=A0ABS1J533_9BACL|nr:L-aspartate oxidase [Tumebacillus amylolyticus]MBL0385383.1 L-aspartate oxidase [Tumebacillus amylolyticus]
MFARFIANFTPEQATVHDTEVIVVGTGIAGLYTALKIAEYADVVILCKKGLTESNTNRAQGGIAAAIAEGDSPDLHREDTLMAGAGLNSLTAVDVLVHDGPDLVEDLIQLGTQFDKEGEDDHLALTKEGAHSRRRILHANGDATGAEIVRALAAQVRQNPRITVIENAFAIDLITAENGSCKGLLYEHEGALRYIRSKATVLATGGAGRMYRYTTNPDVTTADGFAMAYRAGAQLQDLEFIQFHPTVLVYPGAPRFLISEAVRGEGAVLRNAAGERFMPAYHALEELAPRDIVARAIVSEIEKTKSTYVYLDITHQPPELIKSRFPTIYAFCLSYGLDMTTDWIPVAPAQHYVMGGVKTDLYGETNVRRLFACGEVSCTGVHGANRLASNSLSEAIVFGKRIAERVQAFLDEPCEHIGLPTVPTRYPSPVEMIEDRKLHLQKVMVRYVGVKRTKESLERALAEMGRLAPMLSHAYSKPSEWEFINLLTAAMLTAQAALLREESRGGHYRNDFPKQDEQWLKHIVFQHGIGVIEEGC